MLHYSTFALEAKKKSLVDLENLNINTSHSAKEAEIRGKQMGKSSPVQAPGHVQTCSAANLELSYLGENRILGHDLAAVLCTN